MKRVHWSLTAVVLSIALCAWVVYEAYQWAGDMNHHYEERITP